MLREATMATAELEERRQIFDELRRLQEGYTFVARPAETRSPGERRDESTSAED